LRASLHDHVVDNVLFPHDPVAMAPTILAALGNIFPPQAGGFVVGPMLEIGWGSPISFVTAKVGVVIVLPDPKVVLVGALRVALPAPEAPLVDLRAELYGEITPDHLLFLVSLAGSKVAGFPITGDFGLLIGFGDNPEMAFSAGGFHPHYRPPGELAGMQRVSVDLSPPSLLVMRTEAYLALTSNSFQLGCRVQMSAEVAGVGAEGHLQFDAIVRWTPKFSFEIDLTAGVSLFAFGRSFASVDLHLHLEGPGPWVARGSASISILFFDIDFDLPTIAWGSGDNTPPHAVSPQELVQKALGLPSAWAARLPPDVDTFVRLRPAKSDAGLVVHPLGAFEVRQQVVPLETKIDRIGGNPVSEHRVNLGPPVIGTGGVSVPPAAVSHATDLFAPGEYLNLTDDQKMARPGFEPFPAGLALNGADAEKFGTAVDTDYAWETVYPHEAGLGRIFKEAVQFTAGVTVAALRVGPAGKAVVKNENPYTIARPKVALAAPGQVRVASVRDLGSVAGAPAGPMTTTAAAEVAADLVAANASLAGQVQLVGAGA